MTKIKGNPIPWLQRLLLFVILYLYCPSMAQAGPAADTANPVTNTVTSYVEGLFKEIQDSGHYVNALGTQDIGKLPVGIVREINGKVYVIAIDSARLTPQGAYFNAYFRFTFPGTKSELIFGGKNIAFTPGGMGAAASTKLVLLNNKTVPVNEHVEIVFPGDGSNYIEWDCNGFKAANLAGEFQFDKGWLEPEDAGADKLKAKLQVNVHDLSDIMATISIPAFHIHGLKDFSFKVKNATVDMSDIANPAGLSVTSDMLEDASSPNLWRGFYLQELEVGLPKQMATKTGRPTVVVKNFLIDDQGISGALTASNIVPLGDASAGGWPLSITKLGLSFSKNKLNGGTLGGQMRIGFLGEEPLAYDASINMRGGDTYYSFALALTEEKKYPFFAGEIVLSKNSRIEVAKTDKDLVPTATLNGKVNLNKGVLNVKDITFQDLVLSTQKPYVHSGTFALNSGGDNKMASFPISFDSIRIGISEGKIGIGANVKLNFMNSGDKGFSGSTYVTVTAAQKEEKDSVRIDNEMVVKTTTHWSLDKVAISEIKLAVKVMAFKMDGSLTLFDKHPVYGNGFRGALSFSLPGPIPEAKATAYFGSKDDYRYYHVDVYVGLNIPLPPGTLTLTGLMAGLSYHMERPADFDPYASRAKLDSTGGMKEMNEIFTYVPSKDVGLGLLGGLSLAFMNDNIVNVNAAIEVMFGTDGGFRSCQFDGAGYVLHAPVKAKSKEGAAADKTAPIWISFKMRYDNVAKTFDASSKTYINMSVIKGINENGLVGECAMHVGPDDWYFYIGRPSEQFGLNIAGLATVQSYFMCGTRLEAMPPPPPSVTDVFDEYQNDMVGMQTSLASGGGICFGASFKTGFSFDYGVYGEFAIGAGTDVCLRDYGDAHCKGSNDVIGMNGWYASGQAYAYLNGDVGIRVKVLGRKRGFSIAKLSAAVLLQAELPNPSWLRGMVGVKYAILGGMIKGSASIKVELGKQCDIVTGKELSITVINDIKPGHQSTDVSVFATPQVAFNIPVTKPFSMMNNFDVVSTYRVQLDGITLLKDKTQITGTVEVAADGNSASLTLRDILPPQSSLNATAMVHIERQEGAGWIVLKDSSGAVDYERKAAAFKTGDAPDYIPWENVAYTYPMKQQYNFLPKESPNGYIKLKRGQPYLFASVDESGKRWKIDAAFTPVNGQAVNTSYGYDQAMAQVNYTIPANMIKETVYHLRFTRTSMDGAVVSKNVNTGTSTSVSDNGDTTSIANNTLKGDATSTVSKELITYAFRTSRFNTFIEKMSGATAPEDLYDIATGYISVIGQRWNLAESFDKFELEGDANFSAKPLIALKANTNNAWLQNQLLPLLYTGYPFTAGMTITRDLSTGGIPPLDAVRLTNADYSLYQLEDNQVTEGMAQTKTGRGRMIYYVSYIANQDYHELLNKATRIYLSPNTSNPKINKLATTIYPDLQGNLYYPVDLQYRLPGTNQVTSAITKSIYFKL